MRMRWNGCTGGGRRILETRGLEMRGLKLDVLGLRYIRYIGWIEMDGMYWKYWEDAYVKVL